jgi:hypothetical protein
MDKSSMDDAKSWSCPNCDFMKKEIDVWRNRFLQEMFSRCFVFASEESKSRLLAYFMSIPSQSFEDPWKEWNKCLSVLIQNLESKT